MKEIKLDLPAGKYILAVSGGVDSMSLLHLLVQKRQQKADSNIQHPTSNIEFVVAHFNHGIRPDSDKDEELVRKAAKKYQLPFEVGYGKLGPGASEELARKARYQFLGRLKDKYRAKAILTAHHQDDLLETAIINVLRGTGRRGLTAISENPDTLRPLLRIPKEELAAYAKHHQLAWREDPTNIDETYLRNYVRRRVVAKLTDQQRRDLLKNIDKVAKINKVENELIATISHQLVKNGEINRSSFSALPIEIGNELTIYWLRERGFLSYTSKLIERLNLAIRTARPNSRHAVSGGLELLVGKHTAHFADKN